MRKDFIKNFGRENLLLILLKAKSNFCLNYVKIWFDGSVNIFFDLKDKRNYGTFEVIK